MCTWFSMVRTFSPRVSSALWIGRTLFVRLRKPFSPQAERDETVIGELRPADSGRIGSIEHRMGVLVINGTGTEYP